MHPPHRPPTTKHRPPPRSSWLLLHPLTTAKLETESCAVGEAQSWAPVNHVARRTLCSDANMCTTARVGRTEDTPAGHPPGRPAFLASKQISSTWVLGPVPSLFLLSFSLSWCFTGKTHPVWLLEQKWSLTKGSKAEEQSDDGSENQSTPSLVFLGRKETGEGVGWRCVISHGLISHQMRQMQSSSWLPVKETSLFPGPFVCQAGFLTSLWAPHWA